MKPIILAAALAAAALPAFATVSLRRADSKTLDVAIIDEPLSVAVDALAPSLPHPVTIISGAGTIVTYRAKKVTPLRALEAMVRGANLQLVNERGTWSIRDTAEPTVDLDVKDGQVREILGSMQKQCGIRNLAIDPQVQGTGTFVFHALPCRTAFDVVLRTLGLKAESYDNSVVAVSPR